MTDAREPGQGPEVDLRDADERLAAWVDGELTGKDLERFEAELRVNQRLREQTEAYRRFVAATQGALRRPVGSIDIADRVIAAVQRPAAAPRRALLHPWLLSAAVAAGLVAAVWVMQGTGAPSAPELRDSAKHDDQALSDLAENEKKVAEEGEAGAAGRPADKSGVAGFRQAEPKAAGETGVELQEKLRAELGAAKPRAEPLRDDASRDARKLDGSDRKDDRKGKEEAKKTNSDEFFLGGRDAGQLAKHKDQDNVPVPGVKAASEGKAAPEGHADAVRPAMKTAKEPAPAAPQPPADTGLETTAKSLDPQAQRRAGFALEPDAAAVQVVLLTRRGTPEELRRVLSPQQRQGDADQERARQQDQRGAETNRVQGQMLAQQFPSLLPAAPSAPASQAALPALVQGMQLYAMAVPDVAQSFSREGLDQGRESYGNRAPLDDREQQGYRQTLKRLVPDGTRANALYVEGEATRVQDFLQQVSAWAGQNQVEVTFDDVPAAAVEMLEQTQLRSQLGQLQGGQAKQGPSGPSTPGPVGPVTGGPAGRARNVPAPSPGPPQPSRPPTRAVLLLFREQALPEKR